MSVLMVSVSGIRGVIGNGLEPETIVKHTSAFGEFINKGTVVVGRDARITGDMVKSLVIGTLTAKGINVIDIGICPTPTVLLMIRELKADGGIAITASHNPNEWNALKLMNSKGQFMTPDENVVLRKIEKQEKFSYVPWDEVGKVSYKDGLRLHMDKVLKMKHIDLEAIRKRKFKVLVDCVNGAGVYCIPELLREFGCEVIEKDCEMTGIFPRLPEPIPENLVDTMKAVKENNVDLGIVVDPDVDRMVLITEKGDPFIEENTIAQAVRFILTKEKGNVVVNLSTTRTVDDIVEKFGGKLHKSLVGEANVVKKMMETDAIIGGEGSGGIIFPELNFGRDALVGIAITLQHLLDFGGTLSELKAELPEYHIAKRKIQIAGKNPDELLRTIENKYANDLINTEDGIRVDFSDHWVNFRKSNTEPIIRITCEAKTKEKADEYISGYYEECKKML